MRASDRDLRQHPDWFEVFRIGQHCNCEYTVTLYNRLCGYWHDLFFSGYPRKEVIWKLRHEYGLKVSRELC